jgi:hypothetical protein
MRKFTVGTSILAIMALSASVAFAAPLSGSQWKKQANEICTQMQAEINQAGEAANATLGPNEEPSPELLASFGQQFVDAVRRAVASIDALAEPKALRKAVKKFTAVVETELAAVESDPSLLGTNTDPLPKSTKAAKKLGLKKCTEG